MQAEFEDHDDEIHREQAERRGQADEHGHQEPAAREDHAFKYEFGAVQVAAATIMILVTKIPAGGFPGVMWFSHSFSPCPYSLFFRSVWIVSNGVRNAQGISGRMACGRALAVMQS